MPRTEKFTEKVGAAVRKDPNVQDFLTINGYNMLSSSQNTYSGISFVTLKDWSLRQGAGQSAAELALKYSGIGMSQDEGIAYAFSMPPIMGMSTTGGFEGYIQNKTGKTSAELMAKNAGICRRGEQTPGTGERQDDVFGQHAAISYRP